MTRVDETPKEAARRLADGAIRDGFKPQALHEYHSHDGSPIFWRIRLKHPENGDKWIRPMKLNGQGYVLGEPEFPNGKPLYCLHELVTRLDAYVYVMEGETCVDTLAKLGMLATTSGAADSAGKADWAILAGRAVIIWPDNDEAGRRYAETVADILLGLGCSVRMIDVAALNLPPKGDVVDWLASHPGASGVTITALPTIEAAKSLVALPQSPNEEEPGGQDWPEPQPLPDGLPPWRPSTSPCCLTP